MATISNTSLAKLSATERSRLEALLLEFDQRWNDRLLASRARELRPDDPLRRVVLLEMVKIDLERQWRSGRQPHVEAYLHFYPDLGTSGTAPPDLLLAEYQARHRAGDTAELAEFNRRFPAQAEGLRRLLESDPPSAARSAAASHNTTGPRPSTGSEGRPADAAAELKSPFGRYLIRKKLGAGGMGAVYLAHDSKLARDVALKVPHLKAGSAEVAKRFHREAKTAAQLHHANICPILDVGKVGATPYLTMSYIEGRPLSDFVREGRPLSQQNAALVVRKLALALQYAHGRGVVHRDLKPSNIMIDKAKEPVIMDFGLALQVNAEDVRLSREGALLGTPAYMAPEQARGDLKAIGPKTDIYSLGVVLYELLTGKLPFEGTLFVVINRLLNEPPAAPSTLRPDLDPRLEAICLKAMAKQRSDRFGSMKAFAAALQQVLKKPAARPLPGVVESTDPFSEFGAGDRVEQERKWRAARRNRRRVLGGAVAAALLALVLTIVIVVRAGDYGSVKITLPDDATGVAVAVDGDDVAIAGLDEPLRLKAGKHRLEVRGKNFKTYTRSFTVHRGDKEQLRVELERVEDDPTVRINLPAGRLEQKIFPSLVSVRVAGDARMPLGVVTDQGVCTIMPGSFGAVEVATLEERRKFAGRVKTRKPFPFCWIDVPTLDLRPVAHVKKGDPVKPQEAYLAMNHDGVTKLCSGKLEVNGVFVPAVEISANAAGAVALGPVFATDGTCLGLSLRGGRDQPISVFPLHRE